MHEIILLLGLSELEMYWLLWLLDIDLLLKPMTLLENELLELQSLLKTEKMEFNVLLLPDSELLVIILLELIELLHDNIIIRDLLWVTGLEMF